MSAGFEIPLEGAGGEPVDLQRTIYSHGLANLPPMSTGPDGSWLDVTVALRRGKPRTVRVERSGQRSARVTVIGRAPGAAQMAEIEGAIRHILRLDENLAPFYERAASDPALSWVTSGAGRMIRSQTVFEDVIKTICTTNCTWSATERMVGTLVGGLGEQAAYGQKRTFPTPAAIVDAGESFLKEEVKAGYRSAYMHSIATSVLEGSLDLERLGSADAEEVPDDEVAATLLALPGIGPYACAHVMMMLGRYSRPIFDSWTRPTYARLVSRKKVADSTIERRFRAYGPYSGLAFWLFLTKGWVES